MKCLYRILLISIVLSASIIFIFSDLSAGEAEKKTHRIEASFSFEDLSQSSIYGDWTTCNISLYVMPSSDFTYFAQGSFYDRLESDGATGTVGAYKDWKKFLYTFSAITAGSHSSYLPEFRFDHDFNFKLGPNQNFVITIGGSYIDYFTGHSDLIISGGPTYYWNKWILQYRLFYNESNPGSIGSYSQLISLGYGAEGSHWTWLTFHIGRQAYLATYLAEPFLVNRDSFNATFKHRHWIGKHYGIFGDASYFKLEDGYNKFGFSCGVFYEF